MIVEGKGMYHAKGKQEGGHGEQRHSIVVGIKPNQLVYAPTAQQHRSNLHDEQSVGAKDIHQGRQQHEIEVEVVA